ncbi:MAG: hypothetical protein AAF360_14625 [Pseudomonadota bacterium]
MLMVLALVVAGVALWSLGALQTRLQEERLTAQGAAIADAIALQVDAGVPLDDATGFSAAARSLITSEPSLTRVALLEAQGGAVNAAGVDATCPARALDISIRSRNPQVGAFSEIGVLRLSLCPTDPLRLGGVDVLALASAASLALIGVIYFVSIADVSALRGFAAGRAWAICSAAPAAALGVWLIGATGEAYRDRAQAATDLLADRLRPAVDIGIDPLQFDGLEALLSFAGLAASGGHGAFQFALFEGRQPVHGFGAGSIGELLSTSQLDLTASRSVRPRTLSAPALSIVARVGWGPVIKLAPRDHPAAVIALIAYVFAPWLLLSLFGRKTA